MRTPKHKSWWIRVDRHNSRSMQVKAAEAAGANTIYVDGEGEDWPLLIRQTRPGDVIGMTELSRIAPTRKQLDAYLRMALAAGAVIEEASGRVVDNPVQAAAILDALAKLAHDAKARPSEQASKAAFARWNRVSREEAKAAWFDTAKHRLVADVELATNWTRVQLHREFGPRGTGLGGRPRKGKRR